MPRAKQRTPQLRDRVLLTAVARLAEGGVTGFTARGVAEGANTSVASVYELFGDKAGLVREIYFEGFRQLLGRLDEAPPTPDPIADVHAMFAVFRAFVLENRVLAEVMFARPFADFAPGPHELTATGSVREVLVARVQRCLDQGLLAGDATDIAHVLLAFAQGLAAQEGAGWLGRSAQSRDRRWRLAFDAVLAGLAPDPENS